MRLIVWSLQGCLQSVFLMQVESLAQDLACRRPSGSLPSLSASPTSITMYWVCTDAEMWTKKDPTATLIGLSLDQGSPNILNYMLLFIQLFCDSMDCRLLGSSVHGISQARILEHVVIAFSRGSSHPRDRTYVSCLSGRFFNSEPPGKPPCLYTCQ